MLEIIAYMEGTIDLPVTRVRSRLCEELDRFRVGAQQDDYTFVLIDGR